jgi:hypothetical protein
MQFGFIYVFIDLYVKKIFVSLLEMHLEIVQVVVEVMETNMSVGLLAW